MRRYHRRRPVSAALQSSGWQLTCGERGGRRPAAISGGPALRATRVERVVRGARSCRDACKPHPPTRWNVDISLWPAYTLQSSGFSPDSFDSPSGASHCGSARAWYSRAGRSAGRRGQPRYCGAPCETRARKRGGRNPPNSAPHAPQLRASLPSTRPPTTSLPVPQHCPGHNAPPPHLHLHPQDPGPGGPGGRGRGKGRFRVKGLQKGGKGAGWRTRGGRWYARRKGARAAGRARARGRRELRAKGSGRGLRATGPGRWRAESEKQTPAHFSIHWRGASDPLPFLPPSAPTNSKLVSGGQKNHKVQNSCRWGEGAEKP